MKFGKRLLALLLAFVMVTSAVPLSAAADAPAGVTLELSAESLEQGKTERLLILGNDFPVDAITYTVDAEGAGKITIDRDGNVAVAEGYTVPEAGETVTVQAEIEYYDRDDVLYYENFEPRAVDAAGELTDQSEYGRFQGNDWGAELGWQAAERPYVITDENPAPGNSQASRTGRYGVTQVSKTITGAQAPYSYLEEAQPGTFVFWYYDAFCESAIVGDDRFGAGIPNQAGISDGSGSNPVRAYFAGMGGNRDNYAYRSNAGDDKNGPFTALQENAGRSRGWHKFEFRVDAESGTTLWIDGQKTDYADASKKTIEAVALGANFAANAVNIRGQHFVDDMYVVKAGAQTETATLTASIPLKAEGPKEPVVIDPAKNIAPEAAVSSSNVYGNDYTGAKTTDGNYATRWATKSPSAGVALELVFEEPRLIYKAGINSYDSRITGFDIQYYDEDAGAWATAYHYEGSAVAGVTSNASAADTVYFQFAPHEAAKWQLKLNSFSKEPSIWEFEMFEASEDMPFLFEAETDGEITSAGGEVTMRLTGSALTGKAVTARTGGVEYEGTVRSDSEAEVTLSLPGNGTEWDQIHRVEFFLDEKPAGLSLNLVVPAGQAVSHKLWIQYDSPAPMDGVDVYGAKKTGNLNWQNWTLPIGNGYQGAALYGGVSRDLMQVNEESLWSGGPGGKYYANSSGDPYGYGEEYSDAAAIGLRGRDGSDITHEIGTAAYEAARDAALGAAGDATPPANQAINDALKVLFPKTENLRSEDGNSDRKQGRVALGYYKNFAEVFYEFQHDGKTIDTADAENYHRWLDIENSVYGVSYSYNGVEYTREAFASYPARVIVSKFSASEDDSLHFTLNPTVPHLTEKEAVAITADAENKTISLSGSLKQNGLQFAAKFQIVTDGTVTAGQDGNGNGTLTVDGAQDAVVIMSLGTDYLNDYDERYRTGEDPMDAVAKRLDAAVEKGYEALRAEHIGDYQSIFNNVTLSLGGEATNLNTDELLSAYRADNNITSERPAELRYLEELYFQFGRYLLISSSREGTLPANLQGVWNREQYPAWQGDYHLNINLQMNYWPANTTNMEETLYALVDYMDSLRKPGRMVAYNIYGVGTEENAENGYNEPTGWVAHVSSNPFGFTGFFDWHASDTSAGHAQYSPESAMWMMQNIYNLYQYYPDEDYLRERIYPIMREAALFYSDPQILVEDPVSGRLVMSPTYSSEHGPMWGGDTFQQQLLWQLFTDVIEASEILGVDGEAGGLRGKLQELLPRLSTEGEEGPVPIGSTNGKDASGNNAPGVKEWWWETGYEKTEAGSVPGAESAHRHLSHLVGLFPGNLITKDTPEWMEAAVNSLIRRGDGATGWSRGMKTNLWARTGDGNHAYKIFDGLLAEATLNNLWDYHDGPHFQIDGNFGGTAGMVEMLMQSHAGYIEPLPALPDAWPNGEVTGLTMRGGFTVDMAWADKEVTSMQVTSAAGQECSIKYLGTGEAAQLVSVAAKDGQPVAVTVDENGIATFETTEGGVYTVTFSEASIPAAGVTLSQQTAALEVGKTLQLTATVKPENATNRSVSWSSDNPAATVDGDGLVTAVSEGVATITVTTEDGGYKAACIVTVKAAEEPKVPVSGVTLDQQAATLEAGKTLQLTATVVPENASDKSVSWSSNDENVAVVGTDGLVTARAAGKALITVKTADGAFSADCVVTVVSGGSSGGTTGGSSSGTARYTIRADQASGGIISPASASVTRGGSVTFTITANAGCRIADVLVDGRSVGAVESYTFANVTASHTITAAFAGEGETSGTVAGFRDVHAGDWFAEAVAYVADAGFMNGTSAVMFSPDAGTTRGMIVTILYRLAGSPAVESDGAAWWSDARAWAMAEGVSDGTNMEKPITREQLAAMLYRYAAQTGEDVSRSASLDGFRDSGKVSAYALDALKWAVAEGIVNGRAGGVIAPQDGATRAETAAMLMRLDVLLNG